MSGTDQLQGRMFAKSLDSEGNLIGFVVTDNTGERFIYIDADNEEEDGFFILYAPMNFYAELTNYLSAVLYQKVEPDTADPETPRKWTWKKYVRNSQNDEFPLEPSEEGELIEMFTF